MYYKKMIGKKVYLSPIRVEDYEKYTEWVNDMEVAAGLVFANMLIGPESEKAALEELSRSGYNFAIIDKETDELIGNCGFIRIDHLNQVGDIGIFIGNKDYWGKGYGQDIINTLLDFAFNILNMHCMSLRVYSYNEQAIRCYKKVGFKEAGRIRESKVIGGQRYDEVFMDILDSEFKSTYVKDIIEAKKR